MELHKQFLRAVLPSMLAFALSGVYAIADGFFVGNALGDQALAAINVAYPLTAFLQAVGTGIGMGGAVQYAISMGSGDEPLAKRYFTISLALLAAASLLLTPLFLLGAERVLLLFGAQDDILVLGEEYIRWVSVGAAFQILGTGTVPFIRNMGGSVAAMTAMVAGFCTNILLDYLLVWKFPLGMAGAAAATAIGQGVTAAVCLGYFMLRKVRLSWDLGGRGPALVRRVLTVGLSPFGLTFSPNIALILINKSAAIYGGAAAVTCYAPVSYIASVIMLLLQGVSDGSQPLVSRSYGEGRQERADRFRNMAYLLSFVTALLSGGGIYLLRDQVAALFGASPEVAAEVARILPIFLVGFLFMAVSRVATACFYATGRDLWACMLIYGEPLALLGLLAVLPALAGGVDGTWLAVPASQLTAMLLSMIFMVLERRRSDAQGAPRTEDR